jgi:hypothetical protein
VLSAADAALWSGERQLAANLDFRGERAVNTSVIAKHSHGWRYDTDMAKKPKALMSTESGACVWIDLGVHVKVSALVTAFLYSYEGFGRATLALLEQRTCSASDPRPELMKEFFTKTITCKWDSKTSQEKNQLMNIPENAPQHAQCDKYMRVCMDPSTPEDSRKLKLFGVNVYG